MIRHILTILTYLRSTLVIITTEQPSQIKCPLLDLEVCIESFFGQITALSRQNVLSYPLRSYNKKIFQQHFKPKILKSMVLKVDGKI